jgi:hypothetical protein
MEVFLFKKLVAGACPRLISLRIQTAAGSFEFSNEFPGPIKCGEFLE